MSKGQTLQDPFLNALRKDRIPVSIFLVNGIKLQGQIESFDQYVVLLKNTVSQMVYKHAISTVVPARNPRTGAAPAVPAAGGYQGGGFDRGGMTGGFDSGFDRSGFGASRGGFTRTPNAGFDRGGYQGGYQGGGFDRGGFDRSGFEDRGFDKSEHNGFEKPDSDFDNDHHDGDFGNS